MVQRTLASVGAAITLAAGSNGALAATPVVDLLSHRASYRVSLDQADSGSGVSGVRGGLVLEWRADCEGWLSQQRLGFVAESDDGPGFTYDVRFSSWESRDNTQLRFNVRSFDGKDLEEEYRGLARLPSPGSAGTAHYELPEPQDVPLPAGTIFPTAHVADLVAAAEAGERTLSREVFDGSGEDALSRATAVIGGAKSATMPDGTQEQRWPVSVAYFGADASDALPQFEIAFDLSSGGVLNNVRLDYGDFRLKADLEKLETFPAPDCR